MLVAVIVAVASDSIIAVWYDKCICVCACVCVCVRARLCVRVCEPNVGGCEEPQSKKDQRIRWKSAK